MSRDIFQFLEARISEDEAQANAVDLLSSEMETISTHYLPEFAEYMLRWQPRNVRAECDAKREIMSEHIGGEFSLGSWPFCSTCMDWDNASGVPWPCHSIKSLAAPYKDHPDYDPQWGEA